MSRIAVRRLFALVIALFLLQAQLTSLFGEPYPALMMPGFRGTSQDNDGRLLTRDVEITAVFRDGTYSVLGPRELLAQAPDSHHAAIMRLFVPEFGSAIEPDLGGLERWVPGLAIRLKPWATRANSNEMKVWLRSRFSDLYPGQMPARIDFTWYVDRFQWSAGQFERERQVFGRRAIELDCE